MGYVKTKVTLINPQQPQRQTELELLVDSGAIYTIIPGETAERLGMERRGVRKFRLADGSIISRDYGIAIVRIGEQIGGVTIVFGEPADASVIGVMALEALGLQLDPVSGELKPMELLLLIKQL